MYIFGKNNDEFSQVLYILRPQNIEAIKNILHSSFAALKNSEYERIVIRIENLVCHFGLNLNEKYEQLFAIEYPDFYSYLEEEEGFEEGLISLIKSKSKNGDFLWEVNISDYEGYNMRNLFDQSNWDENNSIITKLNKIFERV